MVLQFGGAFFLFIIGLLLFSTIWIFREYERGVVFFLGRFQRVMGPGLVLIIPAIYRVFKT